MFEHGSHQRLADAGTTELRKHKYICNVSEHCIICYDAAKRYLVLALKRPEA